MMPIFHLSFFLSFPPFFVFLTVFLPSTKGGCSARILNYTFMIVVINISRTLTSVSISQRSRGPAEDERMKGENNKITKYSQKPYTFSTMPCTFNRRLGFE